MKQLFLAFLILPVFADPKADLAKADAKRNVALIKASNRLKKAQEKQAKILLDWTQTCQSFGMVLGNTGVSLAGCVEKPNAPTTKADKPADTK